MRLRESSRFWWSGGYHIIKNSIKHDNITHKRGFNFQQDLYACTSKVDHLDAHTRKGNMTHYRDTPLQCLDINHCTLKLTWHVVMMYGV